MCCLYRFKTLIDRGRLKTVTPTLIRQLTEIVMLLWIGVFLRWRCSRLLILSYRTTWRRENWNVHHNVITSAKEVMFSPVSVCLSVSRITQNYLSNLYFFLNYGIVGHNPGPIDYILIDLDLCISVRSDQRPMRWKWLIKTLTHGCCYSQLSGDLTDCLVG